LANILNKVAGLVKKRGIGAVLQAAKVSLNQDELGAAFFVAVDLVLADGVVDDNEKKFLEELQRTIGMDDATATKIAEVVVIKNKA
jgi:tellurite resistance protein